MSSRGSRTLATAPRPALTVAERRDGFPFAFACERSGNCCAIPGGFVRATDAEQDRIARRLGMDPAAFRSRYVEPDGQTFKTGLGHRCVFLDDGRQASCSIYEDRPEQCRTWPFWPENLRSERSWESAKRGTPCPGMDTGSFVPIERIRILRDRTP